MSLWSEITQRVRSLLFRRRDDRELREELEFHVAMDTDTRRSNGLGAAEARRRSLASLGGIERVREEVAEATGTRGTTDLLADAKYAMRNLRQRPAFALVAMVTIAVGVAGATAVFSTFDAVLLRALPYRDPGRLVRLYSASTTEPDGRNVVSPVFYLTYRQRLSSFQSLAAMNLYDVTGADIGTGDAVGRIRTMVVSSDYFDVLRVHPLLGRGFTRDEEDGIDNDGAPGAASVVLSNHLWRERFHGDPAAVGRSMVMSGVAHTVVGVMPPGFTDPIDGRAIDAWVPLNVTPGKTLDNANNHYLSVIGRLAPGVTLARAQAELTAVDRSFSAQFTDGAQYTRSRLYPLKDDVVRGARGSLELILGAVGLMLLLVCVNIANLLLVRASEREREFAMRSALGARRNRLVRQLLVESLVLALGGVLLALPLARVLMSAVVRLGGDSIPRLDHLTLDLPMLAFAVAVAGLSAVIFGLAPAWRAARTDPADVLRRSGRSMTGDRAQGRWRSALVMAQVALAFVLLAGAGVLVASFRKLQQVPLGVDATQVLTFQIHLPDVRYDSLARAAFYNRLDAAIAVLPGVKAAGAISRLPATGDYHSWGVRILSGPVDGTEKANSEAEQRIVTPGYFAAVGLRPLQGRLFDAGDNALAPDRVVISAAFAKALYPGVSPIGQRLRTGGHVSEVIGVVGDVATDPTGTTPFTIYHPHDQWSGDRNWALFEAVRTSGEPGMMIPAIHRVLRNIDPTIVMDHPAPLPDLIGQGVAQRAFTLKLLLAFSLTALFLAALGVFGVLSYAVRLRRQEFGVRMTLGATPGVIRGVVLRQAIVVSLGGVVLGVIGSMAVGRLMASMVFEMSPVDPRVLISVAFVIVVVAGLAGYLPARRATAVEPREVLE